MDPRDRFIASRLIVDGGYERAEIAALCSRIRPGDTVLDIGANIGLYTLAMSRAAGPEGRVVAFEPDPSNVELLERNVAENACENVVVMACALGDEDTETDLYQVDEGRGNLSFADLGCTGVSVKVPVRRGEQVLEELEIEAVQVAKIDVEGAEPLVLEGLGRRPAYIQFEWVPYQIRALGLNPLAMLQRLHAAGYALALIERDTGERTPMSPEALLELADATGLDHNVMATLEDAGTADDSARLKTV